MRSFAKAIGSIGLAPALAFVAAFVLGRDARAASTGMPEPVCVPLDAFAVKELREGITKGYRPSFAGCSLAIDVAGCALPARPADLVYTSGFGHSWGTTLTITALHREGSAIEVTRLLLTRGASPTAKWGGESSDGVKVLRGTIDGAKLEDAIAMTEVVPALTLRELHPVKVAGNGGTILVSGGGWMTSSDFLASITLVVPGATVDRSFVGYSANDTQLESLPLSFSIERLDASIPPTALSPWTFDAAARAIFVAEVTRRAPHFDEQFHWWVREAFVRAAGDGGDASLTPLLRRYLVKTDPTSGERTRIAAISALAAITGEDRRFDASGLERPVDTVALEYTKMLASK